MQVSRDLTNSVSEQENHLLPVGKGMFYAVHVIIVASYFMHSMYSFIASRTQGVDENTIIAC